MGTSDGIAGDGDERGEAFFTFLPFYFFTFKSLFTFLPLKPLQVGDDGLGVGSYLRF